MLIARQVRAAALAPADPSGQDLKVAAAASAMETRAMLEQMQQTAERRAESRKESRGTHLHDSEPCGACAKASQQYAGSSASAATAA
jgi:hypothetical protein